MKPGRRRALALLKIGVAAAAAFLAAELAFRAVVPMDALVYEDSGNPQLAFQLRPGASGTKNGVEVAVNAQGLRDEPVSSPRPAGERRVVVVGGQETFGVGVPAERTFVRELADGLIDPREGRARTINLSMYSYRLSQKVELACLRLQGLEPELAVLQVTEGDISSPPRPLLRFPRLKNWIRGHSALIRWASERYYLRKRSATAGIAGPSEDFEKTREALRRFKACADAAGAKSALMLLPDVSKPEETAPTELRRGVESVAKEDGLPFVDGAAALEAVRSAERKLYLTDPFLSPEAHRVLADALRKRLKPLLKRRPAAPPRRPSV